MNEISVIVCAKNSELTIEDCLKSLRENQPFEIIVVDDGSTDNTVEIAKKYTDIVCFNEGRGIASARQLGTEQAVSDYVSYVDSDVVLPENCLSEMLHEMKESEYAGISAQVISFETRSYWQWAEDQHFKTMYNRQGEREAIVFITAIYKKDTILKHKFDSSFVSAEDGDLCYRLRKNGLTVGVSSAFVLHCHRASARSFIKQRIWYGRGSAQFFWKHKSIKTLLGPSLMIPFGVFACIKRRSPKALPYYLVWSISGNIGMIRGLSKLAFGKFSSIIPQ